MFFPSRIGLLPLLLAMAIPATAQDQQLGARTKGMGGSYTAFEDDPVSVWLNPAGIATQITQVSVSYQTYTSYPVRERRGIDDEIVTVTDTETTMADPAIIPSFLGAVVQVGDSESRMAVGICYARPYYLDYALAEITQPTQTTFVPDSTIRQSLSRFRGAFAIDFRFREPGETGFFSHLALGVGADLGWVDWKFTGQEKERTDTAISMGFGLGALLGLYDNMESFKVNFGVAYQSAIEYDFIIEPDILPAFDMPQQVNVGMTFYLLEGTPLRATIDFQWIDWSATAENPTFSGGFETFQDAFNISMGLEYRIQVSETVFCYPRAGYRLFDPPWKDEDDLPATGTYKLVMDTKGARVNIFSLGIGFSFSTDEGDFRTIDLAVDFGGDSANMALGYTHEF